MGIFVISHVYVLETCGCLPFEHVWPTVFSYYEINIFAAKVICLCI